jgi:hypothetical protein
MKPELNVSALFYKGKLFQIGDLMTSKVEYLGSMGFDHMYGGGILTKIRITTDTVCNSLFLNQGFTYSSIGGLGYSFDIDGKAVYAFECDVVPFPYYVGEKDAYITQYYRSDVNKDKLDNLVDFLDIPSNKISKLGNYLRKNHKEIYEYISLTFQIRQGRFGSFSDGNELSKITMQVLSDNGYKSNGENLIYKLTAGNKSKDKNSLYKALN